MAGNHEIAARSGGEQTLRPLTRGHQLAARLSSPARTPNRTASAHPPAHLLCRWVSRVRHSVDKRRYIFRLSAPYTSRRPCSPNPSLDSHRTNRCDGLHRGRTGCNTPSSAPSSGHATVGPGFAFVRELTATAVCPISCHVGRRSEAPGMSRAGWRWLSRAALDRNFQPNAVLPDDFGYCYSGKSSALNRKSAQRRARRTPSPSPARGYRGRALGAAGPFQISLAEFGLLKHRSICLAERLPRTSAAPNAAHRFSGPRPPPGSWAAIAMPAPPRRRPRT